MPSSAQRHFKCTLGIILCVFISLYLTTPAIAAKQIGHYEVIEIARDLDHPWSIIFLPDGRLLLSERSGDLRLIDQQGQLSPPLTGVPKTFAHGQGGFFDLALHPQYQDNGWIYLSLAYGDRDGNGTQLVRGRLRGNSLVDVESLFITQPLKKSAAHFGGRFAFLADNSIVLGIGDGYNYRDKAQNLDNMLGKIIRINDNGSIPSDNPFIKNKTALPVIYSFGHRNPQGMYYDRERKTLFANEHGARGGDEINIINAGENYGWPAITNGVDYTGLPITPYKERPGMRQPFVDWTPSIAPSSMTVYYGTLFPEMNGDLLNSALKAQEVRWVQLDKLKVLAQVSLFKELGERIRQVQIAPDGALYLLTDSSSGKVLRIQPRR